MDVHEYAGFRLHDKAHTCTSCSTSCSTSFTAENVARALVPDQGLSQAQAAPRATVLAGALQNPKALLFAPKVRGNLADLRTLLDSAVWAPLVAFAGGPDLGRR
ncbi:hypothetical protein AMAG_11187 [Allomyces macrogynus ATCC 38327]|uniref:Uncharacterized protein n=1 Tax=Allomyces macrogynus (strain ATCC 38327) TaxID=578462 RepID=A0A0L0SVZ3_ALLM3|nr:hypothetical protein AMAG_11187 [Allomyces macrogynus ATCC 38327]|eukprot:KNE66687.1 hypothetical protein AMAG_11187 [Allomyces macrogynus ATCC 38327]